MSRRPGLSQYLANWRDSELPLFERTRLVIKNNAIKLARRSSCCGNHGEPGC
ncbi:MAG TPA: hypothetical protein VIY70_09155 [Acidimicrobiia bacterium]